MTTWNYVAESSVSDNSTGVTSIALNAPAGSSQGDLWVAVIAYRGNVSISAPSGGEWTIAEQQSSGNTSTTANASIGSGLLAYCIRGASNPNLTFTRAAGGDVAYGKVYVFRPDTGSVEFVASSSATLGSNSTTVTTASIDTVGIDNLLILAGCLADNPFPGFSAFTAATSPTTASGANTTTKGNITTLDTWVEIDDRNTATGADTALGVARAVKSAAGSTGQMQYTAAVSSRNVALAAAFRAVGGRRRVLRIS